MACKKGETYLSSTSSLPYRSGEYHLKTFDWFTASFPYAFCTNTTVSVADSPALKLNCMANQFITVIDYV
jgi:hypothetical protein